MLLNDLPRSHSAKIKEVTAADGDLTHLVGMGICPGRKIEMVKNGNPMILRIYGTQVGLCSRLSRHVLIEPYDESTETISNAEKIDAVPEAETCSGCPYDFTPAALHGPEKNPLRGRGKSNTGKTTLFNSLTGLLAKTANFPGTTLELRRGEFESDSQSVELIDLPGLYSMKSEDNEQRIAIQYISGKTDKLSKPDAILAVVDSTNLERNLFMTKPAVRTGLSGRCRPDKNRCR